METSFLVVVGIALCFLSAMIAFRMAAGGVAALRIALSVAELWLTLALWVAVFHTLARATGPPAGSGAAAQARALVSGLAGAPGEKRLLLVLGLALSVALAGHLMWSLSRTKCCDIPSSGRGGR